MRWVVFLAVMFAVFAFTVPVKVMAGTDTGDMNVTANVQGRCMMWSVTDINFGSYDPLNVNPTDAQGAVTIRCVKKTNYSVYIMGVRKMVSGDEELNFEIYSDSSRTQIFPSSAPGITGRAGNMQPITFPVYGRIPPGQDVSAGNFQTVLIATVSY